MTEASEDLSIIQFDIEELFKKEWENGKKFDYVRFSIADLNGILRTHVVPRRYVENNLKNGFDSFAGVYSLDTRACIHFPSGAERLGISNFKHRPCKGTLYTCSWVGLDLQKTSANEEAKAAKWLVAEIYCETTWPMNYREGSLVEEGPRTVLRRQLQRLQGLGLHLMSAFEMEYTLLHADTLEPVFAGMDAAASLLHAKFEDYLYTVENKCHKAGLDLEALKIEHGPGQFELVMEPKHGVRTADNAIMLKQAVKEISTCMGFQATFMSLPAEKLSNNGFHLNVSLWKKEGGKSTNAFYDANDPELISDTFRHFLAGLTKHAKALCALSSPTFNCYRRLHQLFTPHKVNWDFEQRNVTFRVKTNTEVSTYLENRLPSSACNPYLVTAATLAAGIDGMVNKLPLPKRCTDEVNEESFKRKVIESEMDEYLPFSLQEALNEFKNDEDLKLALGGDFVKRFVALKEKGDLSAFKDLGDKERWEKEKELYFEYV